MALDVEVFFFFFFPLLLFVVAAMVDGCGGCEMGGWIWWLAALGCERETQRRESQRKRGKIKKNKK